MKRHPFNDGWYFTQKFDPRLITLEEPESDLVRIRLPHTVQMLPFNEFSEQAYQMVSGYLRFLPHQTVGEVSAYERFSRELPMLPGYI